MKPYVIKHGDHLQKIAHRFGFDAEEVWRDAKNAELAKTRTPEILRAGDVLYIPDEPKKRCSFSAQTVNRYVARLPGVPVNIVLTDTAEEPLAGRRYEISGLDELIKGETDHAGTISFEAPVTVKEVLIVVYDGEEKIPFYALIGGLDPVDEESGQIMRLAHLGFCGFDLLANGNTNTRTKEAVQAAIKAFQVAEGLNPTGVADDETKKALVAAHGS